MPIFHLELCLCECHYTTCMHVLFFRKVLLFVIVLAVPMNIGDLTSYQPQILLMVTNGYGHIVKEIYTLC